MDEAPPAAAPPEKSVWIGFGPLRQPVWPLLAALLALLAVLLPLPTAIDTREQAEAAIAPPPEGVHRLVQHGLASWYGDKFIGQLTASGEVFDGEQMTAAHRTLPLGTKVKVTRVGTQRSAVVTITDRGPYVRGRIIDLSPAAAQKLAMKKKGLVPVRLEVLRKPKPAEKRALKARRHILEAAAKEDKERAKEEARAPAARAGATPNDSAMKTPQKTAPAPEGK
jgi:rare lipoprotein A